jgi:hypothetical protein
MRKFLILLLILALGYFAYQSFIQSDAINQESYRQRSIRESGLEDLAGSMSKGIPEALIETKAETDSIFSSIQNKINEWRIIINKE